MPNLLIRICDALFCVLLLRRAILVEVVELAAGEHVVVGPLAVCLGRALRAESPKSRIQTKFDVKICTVLWWYIHNNRHGRPARKTEAFKPRSSALHL